ncbi:hypothetical protein LHP98_03310 [Rhodobacter sp. Har01]|uniref:hypothetical protein n=1 Tax=Rhodobacter sp. Har01 TaxID=2883999 RepID=UPI001D05FD1C|nr:hypothetical protein [Rhodobacter sp. Har01]MCB6177157.1 hypothetical protein [Rhodobacter sp. Har01]
MKALVKLMIATMTLTTALAAVAPAAVVLPGPGDDDRVGRACYDAYGRIVPCKRVKPKY